MNRTIPREEWLEICQGFGNRHRGWLVRILVMATSEVETQAGETDAGEVAMDVPLLEVAAAEEAGDPQIEIALGERKAEVTHRIWRPRALTLEHGPDGIETGLRVDNAVGETTLVRFRVEAAPETQDGVAPAEL